jgi:hypothetical protein
VKALALLVVILLGVGIVGVWQADRVADWLAHQSSGVVYVLIGIAVIASALIFSNNLLTRILGRIGGSSSDERGPQPGDGAVIHHSSGEADFDGLPGDVPPPIKDAHCDQPYPPQRAGD